ncbi:MAG: class I SAM-dependent methyltransferase [Myxococcales bacterium]|nr:class I SAM-dependent methyltransferase [Myxococcales bacterium]
MDISIPVQEALRAGTSTGNTFTLAAGQLDPKLYKQVDAVLQTLGGKWQRAKKLHLFRKGVDAGALITEALDKGEVKTQREQQKEDGWFPTPEAVCVIVRDKLAALLPGTPHRLLEPSAGEGHLAQGVGDGHDWTLIERDAGRYAILDKADFVRPVMRVEGDFLGIKPEATGVFDGVVMNPPFAQPGKPQAFAEHIDHALKFVRPGGVLLAIAPSGLTFHEKGASARLRGVLAELGATIEPLPEGAFKVSGTAVATVLVSVRLPE